MRSQTISRNKTNTETRSGLCSSTFNSMYSIWIFVCFEAPNKFRAERNASNILLLALDFG